MGAKTLALKIIGALRTALKTNAISRCIKTVGNLVEVGEDVVGELMGPRGEIVTVGDLDESIVDNIKNLKDQINDLIRQVNDQKSNFGNLVFKGVKCVSDIVQKIVGNYELSNIEIKEVKASKDLDVEGLEKAIILQTPSKFNKEVADDSYAQEGVAIAQDVSINLIGDPDSKVNIVQANMPKNSKYVKSIEQYQTGEEIVSLSNQTPSYIFSTTMDGPIIETENTHQLYNTLKLQLDFNLEKYKKFLNLISLIWGYTNGYNYGEDPDLVYLKGYGKNNEINRLHNAEELNDCSLTYKGDIDSIRYGCKIYQQNSGTFQNPTKLIAPKSAINIKFMGKCKKLNLRTSTVGIVAKSSEKLNDDEEDTDDLHYSYSLCLIHKTNLIKLAELFIKDDKSFNEHLFELVHQTKPFNRLISVYKDGKLSRFIKKDELETLLPEEEYEEPKTAIFVF